MRFRFTVSGRDGRAFLCVGSLLWAAVFFEELGMNRLSLRTTWALLLLGAGLTASAVTRADALSAMQVLRDGGCGGIMPAARPIPRSATLDRVAQQWAGGSSLPEAAQRSAFRAQSTTGLHVNGPDASMLGLLKEAGCRTLVSQRVREAGLYRRGLDNWIVLAFADTAPSDSPTSVGLALSTAAAGAVGVPGRPRLPASLPASPGSQGPALASRALQLVNEARARGARCGTRTFAPAPPMTLSGMLAGVASGHAIDMAEHNYFEHQDRAGNSPADRVRAVGYPEKLVGENIAYGPESVEEVVRGWLDSPGHCENIMDPRFAQMGIASSAGRTARRGLYWVQLLAAPRA
jgi:uncharacterized protein YkwD